MRLYFNLYFEIVYIACRSSLSLYGRRLMEIRSTVLGNNLPNNLKCVSSLHLFQKKLKPLPF